MEGSLGAVFAVAEILGGVGGGVELRQLVAELHNIVSDGTGCVGNGVKIHLLRRSGGRIEFAALDSIVNGNVAREGFDGS